MDGIAEQRLHVDECENAAVIVDTEIAYLYQCSLKLPDYLFPFSLWWWKKGLVTGHFEWLLSCGLLYSCRVLIACSISTNTNRA